MAENKKPQDALQLLRADHREVEELFEKFENASGDGQKQKLAQEICKELIIHSMIEEEIFYPACQGKIEDDLLKEGYVEHDAAKMLIAEIQAGEPSDEFYDTKVKVLKEEIEHHVKEEEKQADSMFAQARKADIDLDTLGEQMAQRKEELKRKFEKEGVPTPETRTLEQAQI